MWRGICHPIKFIGFHHDTLAKLFSQWFTITKQWNPGEGLVAWDQLRSNSRWLFAICKDHQNDHRCEFQSDESYLLKSGRKRLLMKKSNGVWKNSCLTKRSDVSSLNEFRRWRSVLMNRTRRHHFFAISMPGIETCYTRALNWYWWSLTGPRKPLHEKWP